MASNYYFIEHGKEAWSILNDKTIAILGYGNQGRAQAKNLRDSGAKVIVGSPEDKSHERAKKDKFDTMSFVDAVKQADIIFILVPDEVQPTVFEEIRTHIQKGAAIVFASGYNLTYNLITCPEENDILLLAPRMIGKGVRDSYVNKEPYFTFVSVHQDYTGTAQKILIALAHGIGATRGGAIEVTVKEETELDLFNEQCFGPAVGQVLMAAFDVATDAGLPPIAVLIELYLSGEFGYSFLQSSKLGLLEQTKLHSQVSQYGSQTRAMRYILPELREKMEETFQEIRSGSFAEEVAEAMHNGSLTEALEDVRELAEEMPMLMAEKEAMELLRFNNNK